MDELLEPDRSEADVPSARGQAPAFPAAGGSLIHTTSLRGDIVFRPRSKAERGRGKTSISSPRSGAGRLCHLLATVENGIGASKPQEFSPQPPTFRLVTG